MGKSGTLSSASGQKKAPLSATSFISSTSGERGGWIGEGEGVIPLSRGVTPVERP